MRVFVINLDRRPDRLASVTRQLKAAGIWFERMAAIDGAAFPESPAGISGGMVACHLSHRLCWQALLASGERHALVLEDDVVLSQKLPAFLASPPLPGDADILRLETMPRLVQFSRSFVPGPAGCNLHRLRTPHYGSAAYIVSARAATALLKQDLSGTVAIDHLLNLPERGATAPVPLVIYQVIPALAIQGASYYAENDMPPEMVSDLHEPLEPPWMLGRDGTVFGRVKHWLSPIYDRLRNIRTAIIPFDA